MPDPRAIWDRHMRRVMAQPRVDPRTGEVRPPTAREAEDQIRRVIQRSEAERREGRERTQAKAATPESMNELQAQGGHLESGDGHAAPDEEIRTHSATSNYRAGYDAIDWGQR